VVPGEASWTCDLKARIASDGGSDGDSRTNLRRRTTPITTSGSGSDGPARSALPALPWAPLYGEPVELQPAFAGKSIFDVQPVLLTVEHTSLEVS